MTTIKPGLYRHFKGDIYEVIGVAKHSETKEEMVVYSHDGQTWVRPAKMWENIVEFGGLKIKRFTYIGEEK